MEPNINFPYWYYAGCFNVVDGDTVDLQIDFGFRISMKDRFRLYGINAPELTSSDPVQRDLANKAKQYVISTIFGKTIDDRSLIVKTELDKRDKYGRILVDIYYMDTLKTWHWLNDELIQQRLAVPYII